MSSDVDDEQILPDSLQKLEIVPVYSRSSKSNESKTNESRSQNPFSIIAGLNLIDEHVPKDIFGPTCTSCENADDKCRTIKAINFARNATQHYWRTHRGNMSNQKTMNSICNSNNGSGSIEHSIQKQIYFKQRSEKQIYLSDKKLTILRDPILKSIGRSIYHNSKQHQNGLCCNLIASNGSSLSKNNGITTPFDLSSRKFNKIISSTIESGFDRTVHSTTTNSNNVMINNLQKWQLDDESTIDFKSLVNDCSNMSLLNTSTNHLNECSINELHKTRNFQVLQTSTADTLAIAADLRDAENSTDPDANANNLASNSNSNSSLSNNSSSCSQQARMNSSNCDVTTDELASYFETFVHIPKKMSSMAEMMYI